VRALAQLKNNWRSGGVLVGLGPMQAILVFSVILGPFILYYIYHFRRCPICKRRNALRGTGAKREGGRFGRKVGAREEECKYCGYRHWAENASH
jgi:hypothetical protein